MLLSNPHLGGFRQCCADLCKTGHACMYGGSCWYRLSKYAANLLHAAARQASSALCRQNPPGLAAAVVAWQEPAQLGAGAAGEDEESLALQHPPQTARTSAVQQREDVQAS